MDRKFRPAWRSIGFGFVSAIPTMGAVLVMVSVVAALAVLVTRAAFWLAFVPLLIAWAGVAYAGGGRTGFCEVHDDGGLGQYIGRSQPEVGSMRPNKPWR